MTGAGSCFPHGPWASHREKALKEFSPEHNTPVGVCRSVMLQDPAEVSLCCCAFHKDNPCSEGFVFCLGPKRKILKKKAVIGKA